MANAKRTRSRRFAQFKGKIIDTVELDTSEHQCVIGIMFRDRTYLSFDVRPGLRVLPELSDWKTKDYSPLKRWREITT